MDRLMYRYLLAIFICCFSHLLSVENFQTVPVSYNGRFIPLEVSLKLQLQELHGKQQIKSQGITAFDFFLKLYAFGTEKFDETPLFFIHYAKVKKILGLNEKESHFSYHQLKAAVFENKETNLKLMQLLIPYFYAISPSKQNKKQLSNLSDNLFTKVKDDHLIIEAAPNFSPWHFLEQGSIVQKNINLEKTEKEFKPYAEEAFKLIVKLQSYKALKQQKDLAYEKSFYELKERGEKPKEIALLLESRHPLNKRLIETGNLFKAIPDIEHNWHSIDALNLKIYDALSNALQPIHNFTPYSDLIYEKIQQKYQLLQVAVLTQNESTIDLAFKNLSVVLDKAYQELEKKPYKEAFDKTLFYPSKSQLKAEFYYYHYPITKIATIFYLIALMALFFGKTLQKKSIDAVAFFFLGSAFLLHTTLLLMRTFILNRPPVSNMFETVLYVPWIAVIVSFIFYLFEKNRWLLIASSFSSLFLLILLEITGMHQQLENVQAVLDSNYWLTIHVLLIVGSYGVFFLCGLLGQIYLGYSFFHPTEKKEMKFLSKFILQTMYLGVFMLIPGTILGGVWAAESWGRFWDWDPKESWAFISSCTYLAVIHGYRFHKISSFGLSLGAVIGLMAISFTWYGVNYILGTGLHSYGFGTGKDVYYYLFLILQTAFLIIVSIKHQKRLELKSKNLYGERKMQNSKFDEVAAK